MKEILMNIILSGAGATFFLFIIMRLIPNEKLRSACVGVGRFLSGYGRSRLGRTFWEKVEDYLENSINVCWEGFCEGLNHDDMKEERDTDEK